ncbi:hypothetical protein [Jonesia quinghaiensis]|uniref:hypothetical protein n=1 Tax=Jonesia quinghaiensis TaxID=262806 RepID=UPI0004024597|nr:hypothetical protein [Jonesia quinghaiensis]
MTLHHLTHWADPHHVDQALLRAGNALWHRETAEYHGHTDFCDPFDVFLTEAQRAEYYDRDFVVMTETPAPGAPASGGVGGPEGNTTVNLGGSDSTPAVVTGFLQVSYPLKDNTHLAFVWIVAAERSTSITTQLLAEAEKLATQRGRTTLMEWTDHREAADGEPAMEAATGVGRINPTDSVATAYLTSGWTLEQTERHSILQLPADQAKLDEFAAASRSAAHPEYDLVWWTDRTPDEFLDGHVRLSQAMSTDVPQGDLDMQETDQTPERVRYMEDSLAATGKGYLAVAARHIATGDLAGYTRVDYPFDRPEAVFQEATLVRKGHRGHRLGMWMKADMLSRLQEIRPQARRLHTWNASENDYMLSINIALGFELHTVEAAWQKKIA